MAYKLRMCEDSTQVRMSFELDAEQVESLAFGPICSFPNVDSSVDGGIIAGYRHFQPQPMLIGEREHVIHDVVTRSALAEIIHGRHIKEHFEIELRICLKRPKNLLGVLALDRD